MDSVNSKFWLSVDFSGDCWRWGGYKNNVGYGMFWFNKKKWLVHRLVYTEMVGPIPQGLSLDHLCRNPSCCNPNHLEPVTHVENMRRSARGQQSHCKRGHSLSGDNLRIEKGRYKRTCKTCARDYQRKRKARING